MKQQIKLGMMLHLGPEEGQTPAETLASFTALAQTLEQLGYQEAWVLEHHFNPHSLTPAPLILMTHFLAHTQHLKLGSAAILLGFHNPISIAEQLALLANLYPGRIACGFAKGGPFVKQNAVFNADTSGKDRMLEAIPALVDLLNQPTASHQGDFYQWQDVDLQPKAQVNMQDFYLASGNPDSIALAAKYQMGIMAAQFWNLEQLNFMRETYAQFHKDFNFMAARGVFISDHADDARHQAWSFIQQVFSQRSQLFGGGKGSKPDLTEEQLLAVMLVGTEQQVAEKTKQLIQAGVNHLAINPLVAEMAQKTEQLARFKQVFSEMEV